jgi:RND superfamily putative drug exporter
MNAFASFVAGRRTKFVVFGAWFLVLIGALAFNLPGKYTEAEENESSSFLPADAESTKALAITERLQDGERAPTVIVYQRDGGLTPADRQAIGADVQELNGITGRFRNTSPFGNPTDPEGEPFQLSEDGTTALVTNSIVGTGDAADILDPVDAYREAVTREEDGLDVKVGGPAGVSADAIKIFENINGTLIGAALLLVLVLLIIIYRSPIFWIFPLFSVVVAEIMSRAFGYGLTEVGVTVNGQSSAIGSIIVLGAGTDYALLLVARYREELRRHEDKHDAMRIALRAAAPAIFASGLTVAVTLLSLTLAKVNSTAGLGPTGAVGVLTALLVMLTFLPALLLIVGRRPFWPRIPHFRDTGVDETHGSWRRLGDRIAVRPRRVWVGTVALLLVCSLGLLNFSTGLTQGNSFRDDVESIEAQELIAGAFPSGQSAPTDIVVSDPSRVEAVQAAVSRVENVATVRPTGEAGPDGVLLNAFLRLDPYSTEAFALIPDVRSAARSADPQALVGGSTAIEADLREAAGDDTLLLVPIALLIVFVILLVLLRALVASILLIATVVLSFAASLGVAAIVYDVVFGFPGSDPSLPLFAFIFLVALGVDYNIFLIARVREEVARYGTRTGMIRGLAVTGGVITSAGIVLAGTFSVLAVLPLVFLTEIGFVIAFGVLLDTFLVRSVLVPALVLDTGPRVWWPSSLAREADHPERETSEARPETERVGA